MQLRNGKCYISEVTAWWNANKAKTADVQTIIMAVAMDWMSQECLRRLMWSSYARHLAEVKKAEEAEEEEEDEDEDEDEDEFECPECCCVLKGDAANDERTWIALKCDCGDGDENCANCGYDVCMECEDAVMARETAEGNARE